MWQILVYSESHIYEYMARVFIMSYYIFKMPWKNEFNINILIAFIFQGY